MIVFLTTNPACGGILVEKTDRLYRNFKDYVTIDDLGVDVHLVKESAIISRNSSSNAKFMHGIKVLMAKNYIDNLSEEVRKGLRQKASEGYWPTLAPLGYNNVVAADGKRIIVPDAVIAPAVRKMFERYATGKYSVKEVGEARSGRWFGFSKEWRHGPYFHGPQNPQETGVLRRVRLQPRNVHRQVRRDNQQRTLARSSRCAGRSPGQAAQKAHSRFRVLGSDHLRPLRLRASRRDQEGPVRVLPLHGLSRKVPRALHSSRRCWRRRLPACWNASPSARMSWLGSRWRCARATGTRRSSTRRPEPTCSVNTAASRNESMLCTWTSWMAGSTTSSSIVKQASSVPSRAGSCVTLRLIRPPTAATSKKVSSCWSCPRRPHSCSIVSRPVRNGNFWILYYRTAVGSRADSMPNIGNRLI